MQMRSSVVPISAARARPRVPRVIAASRKLARPAGRVWLNGRELGGPDPRYAHLDRGGD